MKIYLLPGLAADERVFRHIRFPSGYQPVCLPWVKPKEGENLGQFAMRMAAPIDKSAPFMLFGLSLGGMLATEIARIHPVEKLILLSSIAHPDQFPPWYRPAYRAGGRHLLFPTAIKYGVYLKRVFTSESAEDKQMIRQMAREMDNDLIRNCIRMVVDWQVKEPPLPAYKIHGSADWLFPLTYTTADAIIKGGGHLMVLDRAAEINSVISTIL